MIKKITFIFLLLGFSSAQAADISTFLKSCGYGALVGASLGVVSLAFSDRPGEQVNNIARGASLGLYAGIGYGLYNVYGETPSSYDQYHVTWTPQWKKEGFQMSLAYRF